jgi:hypothetical protein
LLNTNICNSFFQDPVSELLKLADYLEFTCSREVIVDIAEKFSFQNLKAASENMKDHGEMQSISGDVGLKVPDFYRKGIR